MKLYAKTISATLPDWATVVTKSADLFEIEINDEHPDFQLCMNKNANPGLLRYYVLKELGNNVSVICGILNPLVILSALVMMLAMMLCLFVETTLNHI
ncbi:MAG: hypothetical protein HWQ43_14500 [Nostoc sp. JL31]|uniref:hypothetical protein n=1 Tax=Nostoc sp. JL31 TaxID=2815395 RepID=UPI0025E1197D|nr:hypothetical protein [Nostoc sp. JL31]MBN3890316.1 hypothetical protein [Nostoc sp. JL31]